MSYPNSPFNSGFPFDDRDFDRNRSHSSFRTQLDDLAKRHPEFAEHLNIGGNFPFRSHTLGRRRRDSDNEKPSGSQDAEFSRRYSHDRDRPFSRFDQFNFPFRQYFEDDIPDFYEPRCRGPDQQQPQYTYTAKQTPAEEAQQQQQQKSQPSSPQPSSAGATEKPPQIPNFEGRKPNIQQSNTVDLGQKQEPVDENRGQRSMSAPPENRSTGQRFVSSIHIPIQRPSGGGGDMGAKASTPETQQQTNKPNERVIPIHVEGRDEPIIPKNVNATFTQAPPQQPQAERIFGRNPSHFTQFVNKGEPHGMSPEEHYRQQQQQYQKQQQQNFQQQQQQQQNQNEEPQQPPTPTPSSLKQTQLDQIQNIQKDVSELMNQVEKFNGKPKDKQYLYLDEMLTRNLIKLDNIETEGKDNIRQARKEAIKCIEGCIGILEAKANANLAAETPKDELKMEVEKTEAADKQPEQTQTESTEKPSEQSDESVKEQPVALEISGVARTGSVTNVTPMEVVEDANKQVPAEAQNDNSEKKESDTQPTTDNKIEEVKNEEGKNVETNPEKVEESSAVTETSPNSDTASPEEDKKEKKKGKKKDKSEKV